MPEERDYKPFRRFCETLSVGPKVFRDNVVAWLAVLAFSAFFLATFVPFVWGLYNMWLDNTNPLQWFVLAIAAIVCIAFMIASLWAMFSLVVLAFRAVRGIRIKVDETTPRNVLDATTPVVFDENEFLKQLQSSLREIDKLIAEYISRKSGQ